MGIEIERKFLCGDNSWREFTQQQGAFGVQILQGYLSVDSERIVRVRLEIINDSDTQGVLTVKGLREGSKRPEYEYLIPPEDARDLIMNQCLRPWVDKTRYSIATEPQRFSWVQKPVEDRQNWVLDIFHGSNEGLVLNEVELKTKGEQLLQPPWVDLGKEVTYDDRFYSANLVLKPYNIWTDSKLQKAMRMGEPIVPGR